MEQDIIAEPIIEVINVAPYWSPTFFPVIMPDMNSFARTSRIPRSLLPTSMPFGNSVSPTDWLTQCDRERPCLSRPSRTDWFAVRASERENEREIPSVPVSDLDPMRPGLIDDLNHMQIWFEDSKTLVIGRKLE